MTVDTPQWTKVWTGYPRDLYTDKIVPSQDRYELCATAT